MNKSKNKTLDLFQSVPLIYVYNNRVSPGSDLNPNLDYSSPVESAYRQVVPTYQLPDKGIYQSFQHGNTLFIITDSITFLNVDKKTLFGNIQLNWIISKLKNAATDPTVQAVIITMTQPWNYVQSAYDWDMIKQNYDSLNDAVSEEKVQVGATVIRNFNFNRPGDPNFKPVMMVIGDPHLAFDEGTWNNYGNFPIAVCGPLDFWQQCRGGPYSHGSFHDSPNQYCIFNVYYDQTLNNGTTCIRTEGIIASNQPKQGDQTVFIYDTCQPGIYQGRINLKCPIDYKEKLLNAGITIGAIAFVYFIFFVLVYRATERALSFNKLKDS